MAEWEVFGVIVALLGFVAAVVPPMLKLNTSITKLTVTMEAMSHDVREQRDNSREAHKNLWAGIEGVERQAAENKEKLGDHEHRIQRLEEKDHEN